MTYKVPQGRFYLILMLGLLGWFILILRLFQIQVVQGKTYQKISDKQHQLCLEVSPQRGAIYDRNLQVLAFNLPSESFFAIPESLSDIYSVAEKFSSITSFTPQEIIKDLEHYKKFAWLKRKVNREESELIRSWNLVGVYSKKESKRVYPFGDLADEVLGFANIDDQGSAGVEYQYDQTLRGKTGQILINRDAKRRNFALKAEPLVKCENGNSLVLTLDLRIQAIVEEELRKAIESNRADGGTSVWMDPKNGEILAMAHYPKNENGPSVKTRSICNLFEPGSTFKIVTMLAALEEKIKNPEDSIYAEKGEFEVNNHKIHDVHKYEWLTFRQCTAYSSNIAFAKVALQVGKNKLYRYARNLGFGLKTGVDLPWESKGALPPLRKCSDFVLSTLAFGQGVSLNSLQLLNAYAAVANGGYLMKPYIVKAILNQEGDTIEEFLTQKIRQAISPLTCQTMNDLFRVVVDSGTGYPAKVEGLDIAGKTGTAQKPDSINGGYKRGEYLSSFIGYFPASQPKFVGLVYLDNPKGKYYGSETAAPAFRNMAQRLANLQDEPLVLAKATTSEKNIIPQTSTGKPKGKQVGGMPIMLGENSADASTDGIVVPNALGMTVRQAAHLFSEKKINFKIIGSGVVKNQTPSVGSRLNPGQICLLHCETE
jgi:cell division protein FtsI (penicillin-binding protein 3)